MKQSNSNLLSSQTEYTIRALQRGLLVLDALLESGIPLSLEQISERTDIPKSTAFRIVANLISMHYLVETHEGYWLGLKFLRLGALVEEKLDLVQLARPILVQLRDHIAETVHLSILDDDLQAIHLLKLSTQHAVVVQLARGSTSSPLHATSFGKVLAAYRSEGEIRRWIQERGLPALTEATITDEMMFMDELHAIRERGYATDVDEYAVGVRCVAAPIHDRTGTVIAAISASGPAQRMPFPLIGSEMAARVVDAAQQISCTLGYCDTPAL